MSTGESPNAGEGPSAGRRTGERAIANTLFRVAGEIGGKLASLVLFAVLAREVSTAELGTFVLALAWGEVAMTPVGLGIDRYLLRRLAENRSNVDTMFFNALALKLWRGLAMLALSVAAAWIVGYDADDVLAIGLVTVGAFGETLSRTHMSVFNAFERGDLVAGTIVVQRVSSAVLGIVALLAGAGVVAVCATFAIGAMLRLVMSFVVLERSSGTPARALPRDQRRELTSRSLAFTAQDLFGLVIQRADVLLLAALATDTVVGAYGSAYRLFDATTFVAISLTGAFSAMYTYLGPDTTPTVRSVFQRSVKLSLIALVPIAVAFGVLAEPICRAAFGGDVAELAAGPLRLLAPVVAIWGAVVLAGSLVVSRQDPKRMLAVVAGVAAVNLALNLALIPPFGANGAAGAMLGSTIVYVLAATFMAVRAVGGVNWIQMIAPPLLGGLAMAVPMALLTGLLPLALVAGGAVYLAAYAATERLLSPDDLDFAVSMVKRRLGGGRAAAGGS